MTIADKLTLLASSKEALRAKLGLPKSIPLSEYYKYALIHPEDSIRAQFAVSKNGIWLDPSDLSTLYQESSGITPVTKDGDPVGLMLDKSQGIYGDIVFDDKEVDIENMRWYSGTAQSKSKRTFTTEGTGGPRFDFNLTEGKTYKIDLTITSDVTLNFYGGTISGAISPTTSRTLSNIFKATGSDNLYIRNNAGGTTTVEFIQVQEIKGNHAWQPLAASRPTYRTDGVLHWLQFDGVDDFLDVPNSQANLHSTGELSTFVAYNSISSFGWILYGNGYTTLFHLLRDGGTIRYYPLGKTIQKTIADSVYVTELEASNITKTASMKLGNSEQLTTVLDTRYTPATSGGFTIGSPSSQAYYQLNGTFRGLLMFTGILKRADKEAIRNYLQRKAGVEFNE